MKLIDFLHAISIPVWGFCLFVCWFVSGFCGVFGIFCFFVFRGGGGGSVSHAIAADEAFVSKMRQKR